MSREVANQNVCKVKSSKEKKLLSKICMVDGQENPKEDCNRNYLINELTKKFWKALSFAEKLGMIRNHKAVAHHKDGAKM